MEELIRKYSAKLVEQGLAEDGAPLLATQDDEIYWSREGKERGMLREIFARLNINALLYSKPAEPYHSIIRFLAGQSGGIISPRDCETRTFLHDLPVANNDAPATLANWLKRRKSVITTEGIVLTSGTVSPEQAFITFSSVCFACFVKFFADYLQHKQKKIISAQEKKVWSKTIASLDTFPNDVPHLMTGPFSADNVHQALIEAGQKTVSWQLVDSYFGNISYRVADTLFISQTGSSLDELTSCIDHCPMDGSTCTGITASSELAAHQRLVQQGAVRAVLHGHPKFSVILSMVCERKNCPQKDECHLRCPEVRFVDDVPIVPGEVGTGPHGLCHTLPPALNGRNGAIVYGHGVFTTGKTDFNEAFSRLITIEKRCRELCLTEAC
jgi:ribulose-5-phosphate 4-epimerase/fuculose-1-phosphate aldolase